MGINLDNVTISVVLIKKLGEIDHFNGGWPKLKEKLELKLSSLKHISTIASIGSSTRIEGVTLSNTEIESFLQGLETHSFLSRDQQEVMGYKELLDEIFNSFEYIDLTENYIKQFHKILLNSSEKDHFHSGEYKKFSNSVVATKNNETVGVVFQSTTPFDTPREMEALIKWYQDCNDVHPLIKIAVFIVHFLFIHPFQDGNGRLSRALTTFLMLKEGYYYVPYCSHESIVEKNKQHYYLSQRNTQKTLTTDKVDYTPWLEFFFNTLRKQVEILSEKDVESMVHLTKTQRDILNFSKTVSFFKNSDLSEALNMNRNTVKVNLKKLTDLHILKKEGLGRGTYYKLF